MKPGRAIAGLSMIELLIAMAIGLVLVLAATSLLVAEKTLHASYLGTATLEDNARLALSILTQAVRQTAYRHWDDESAVDLEALAGISADIGGLDHQGQSSAAGLDRSGTAAVNGSDVLALRFAGSGAAGIADGSMLDCAGNAVAAPDDVEVDRGWSIFHIAQRAGNEPELYCKYHAGSSWPSQPLVAGVEALQVLYGVDGDGDGLPERYLNAGSLDAIDAALGLAAPGSGNAAAVREHHRKTSWKQIVSIRLALVMRAPAGPVVPAPAAPLHLFGEAYAQAHEADDPGTSFDVAALPAASRGRARKVFVTTIMLYNRMSERS